MSEGNGTHLVIWLKGLSTGNLISAAFERADDLPWLVLGRVLVKLIDVDLEVLRGLGEAERVEATVTYAYKIALK